jgi:hypothetical protein
MVRRYRNVSGIREIVDGRVDLKVLGNEDMFKEDNKVSEEFISEYVRPELILRGVDNKLKRMGYEGAKEGDGREEA